VSGRLLDGNVLIALAVADHVHHAVARTWWLEAPDRFATTPMTQGTLLRFLLRERLPVATALGVLDRLTGSEHHEFWPDDAPFTRRALRGVMGHRQVTDAYLAELARRHRGRLVTLDAGLASVHADVAELLPV
jgi:toxin-antitoxin system PIN domain toxin